MPKLGKGLPDPDLPTAEDKFVDAEADFGREAEERRGGGVAVHDFVLSSGYGTAGVEEVGIYLAELAGGEEIGVFAVGCGVPAGLSADHGYWSGYFGRFGLDVGS